MNQMNNTGRDRALYEKVKSMAAAGVTPMMATLRQQAVLANNNTTYKFDFNEQKGTKRETDILLSIKDSFYANAVSIGILTERKNKTGSGVIYYYPEAYVLANGGASAVDLECVYNAILKAQIDRDVLLDKLSTRRFRRVPQRQAEERSYTIGGGPVGYASPAEQISSDGQVNIEPNIVLRGTKNNEFTITLPTFQAVPAIAASDPAWEVSIVMELHGFLIPGGAGLNS